MQVNRKRLKKITRQKLALRTSLWPKLNEEKLWQREFSDGWLSIPRAMPILLQIMDNLSEGKPVSAAYLDLWCRAYDDSFIIANKPREMAFFSGFTGERAERTWNSRIQILQKLGFIEVKNGPNGPISYVLIYNPYLVVEKHYKEGRVHEAAFNGLQQRMIEIGARDLEELTEEKVDEIEKPISFKKKDLSKSPTKTNKNPVIN